MSRKHVEKFIYETVAKLTGTKVNSEMYKSFFKGMSNKQFDVWIKKVYAREEKLYVTVPNNSKEHVDVNLVMKLAKDIGLDMFDYIVYDKGDTVTVSPIKACVIDLPCRRVSQLLDKGLSVSKDDKSTDKLTGQPIGSSRSASMSNVETDILVGVGLTASARELNKARGGDVGAYSAFKALMLTRGAVDLDETDRYGTGVGAVKTMGYYLKAKMIGNNLYEPDN